jgi:pimeloyl-ACP methyl ester carboxylesterase
MSTTATGTALTAENRSLEIDGATLRYRRFGDSESTVPPLLCLQHFRGNLDNWDPALVDPLAADREVILLDNRGVGGSTGVVPDNVEDMARDALGFIDALALAQVDLLGFSLGGFIAQEIALVRPRLVRRLVLAGRRRRRSTPRSSSTQLRVARTRRRRRSRATLRAARGRIDSPRRVARSSAPGGNGSPAFRTPCAGATRPCAG